MKFSIAHALAAALMACTLPALAADNAAAQQATRERRWNEALALWQVATRKNADDTAALSELGWAELETGRTPDARRTFQRVLRLSPNHVRATEGLVEIALRETRADDALRMARDLTRANPESATAWRTLARAQKALARRSEAEASYRQAVALDAQDATARAGLADVLFLRNKAEDAVREYREAVRLDPANNAYREGLGRAAMQGGRYAQAAAAFAASMEGAMKPQPDWPRLDALALSTVDALGRAATAYRGGRETSEDFTEANTRALAVADALARNPSIRDADPVSPTAMSHRALAYDLLGQAAASDLAALKKRSSVEAADAVVFREQARRALVSARAAALPAPP